MDKGLLKIGIVALFCSQFLLCNTCKIVKAHGGVLKGYCNGTSLDVIPPEYRDKVTVVWLRFNSIHILRNNTFLEFHRVKKLDLSHNSMEEIEQGTFAPLKDLESLDLSFNKIKKLGVHMFAHNKKLFELDLSSNVLLHIPTDKPFLDILSLVTLKLPNCELTSLSASTFTEMRDLQTLDLSGNLLHAKELEDSLEGLPKLEHLLLSDEVPLCDEKYGVVMEKYGDVMQKANPKTECTVETVTASFNEVLLYVLASFCGVLFLILILVFISKCRCAKVKGAYLASRVKVRSRSVPRVVSKVSYRRIPTVVSESHSSTTATTTIEDTIDGSEVPTPASLWYYDDYDRYPLAIPMNTFQYPPIESVPYIMVFPCQKCHQDMRIKSLTHDQHFSNQLATCEYQYPEYYNRKNNYDHISMTSLPQYPQVTTL